VGHEILAVYILVSRKVAMFFLNPRLFSLVFTEIYNFLEINNSTL